MRKHYSYKDHDKKKKEVKKGCEGQESQMNITVTCTEAVVSYPPEMEDFLQFFVHSIQEDVRPGRPVFVHR